MPRLPCATILLVLGLCVAPQRATAQASAYFRLSRVVGAIRTAALLGTVPHAQIPATEPVAPTRSALLALAAPVAARRLVMRLTLVPSVQLRATSDWNPSGPLGTLGVSVRF